MGGENKEIINNNNSEFITPSFNKSEMITKLNEWKELYINDVEIHSIRVGEVEEAVTVLNDFIMYVRYLD